MPGAGKKNKGEKLHKKSMKFTWKIGKNSKIYKITYTSEKQAKIDIDEMRRNRAKSPILGIK